MTHSMPAKGQDEIEYLKVICEALARNRASLESGCVDLDKQFFEELKRQVDSTLTGDSCVEEEVRTKVLDAFDMLIENYPRQTG